MILPKPDPNLSDKTGDSGNEWIIAGWVVVIALCVVFLVHLGVQNNWDERPPTAEERIAIALEGINNQLSRLEIGDLYFDVAVKPGATITIEDGK